MWGGWDRDINAEARLQLYLEAEEGLCRRGGDHLGDHGELPGGLQHPAGRLGGRHDHVLDLGGRSPATAFTWDHRG